MICNKYALLWLAAKVVSSHGQFDFLEATREPIPPVEVPREDVFAIMEKIANDYGSEAVAASEVWKKLPTVPDDYPDSLKGVLWMDQPGSYGYQNITAIAPTAAENLVTFGDANLGGLDTENRMQWNAPCGGAWTIDPIFSVGGPSVPAEIFHSQICTASIGVTYFIWNEDYTVGNVYSYNETADFQDAVPTSGRVAMVRVPEQPEGTCPPAEDATKEERNLCAKFIRVSYSLDEETYPYGFVYPVFEVVGADGVPREPYYSAYLDWMEKKNATMQHWRPLMVTMEDGDTAVGDTATVTDIDTDPHGNKTNEGSAGGEAAEPSGGDKPASESSGVQIKTWTAVTLAFASSMLF